LISGLAADNILAGKQSTNDMWICSTVGYYSIARRGQPGAWQVRARCDGDLERLRDLAGLKTEILSTPEREHPFRMLVDSDGLQRVFAALAQSIQYPEFKRSVESHAHQHNKLLAYEDFFKAMRKVQILAGQDRALGEPSDHPLMAEQIVKQRGGNLARLLETLNGFREKYGHLPTKVQLANEMLETLRVKHLTPLGFQLLQAKLQFSDSNDGIRAEDDAGLFFDYSKEGWSGRRQRRGRVGVGS
jgi:hypothetical protein